LREQSGMTLDNEKLRPTLRSNGDVELSLDAVSVANRVLYPTEKQYRRRQGF